MQCHEHKYTAIAIKPRTHMYRHKISFTGICHTVCVARHSAFHVTCSRSQAIPTHSALTEATPNPRCPARFRCVAGAAPRRVPPVDHLAPTWPLRGPHPVPRPGQHRRLRPPPVGGVHGGRPVSKGAAQAAPSNGPAAPFCSERILYQSGFLCLFFFLSPSHLPSSPFM